MTLKNKYVRIIGGYEMTQEQWAFIMGDSPAQKTWREALSTIHFPTTLDEARGISEFLHTTWKLVEKEYKELLIEELRQC